MLSKRIASIVDDHDLGVIAQVARAFALPQTSRLRHLLSRVNEVRTTPKDHRFLDPRVPDDFDAWKIVQVDLTSLNLKSFRVRHNVGTEDTASACHGKLGITGIAAWQPRRDACL